jgi:hypothetical protein
MLAKGTMWNYIKTHHKGFTRGLWIFLFGALFWDKVPAMVKLVLFTVAILLGIYIVLDISLVSKYIGKWSAWIIAKTTPRNLGLTIGTILSVIVILLVFIFHYPLASCLAPPQNIYINKGTFENPLAVDYDITKYQLALEFGVQSGELDPVDIVIDTNGTFANAGLGWYKPRIFTTTDNWTPLGKSVLGTSPGIYRIPTQIHFFEEGESISRDRSLYIVLFNSTPFSIKGISFGGKHYHYEGDQLVVEGL